MSAEIVQLQQLHALCKQRQILLRLRHTGKLIDDIHAETGSRHDALDLARICNRIDPVDGVFKFHLGQANRFHLLFIIDKAIGKLEPRRSDRVSTSEQAQDRCFVVLEIRHMFDVTGKTSCQQRAELSLEAAAGNDWISRERIADNRTVDRTDRGKGAGRADMHTGSDDQITLNQNFPVHTYASLPP